jgi:hypothetical protein
MISRILSIYCYILLVCCLIAVIIWRKHHIECFANKRDFLTVICRVRDEHFLMKTFVPYYLSQGADRIYIIDDGTKAPYDKTIVADKRVVLMNASLARSKNDEMADVNALYNRLRNRTEWVMCVDADEFVYATPKYDTIRSMLQKEFSNIDCVHVPWVIFSFEGRERDAHEVITDYRMRWNHDAKHHHPNGSYKNRCRYNNIEVKSIFRPSRFGGFLNPHVPKKRVDNSVVTVDSVHKKPRVSSSVMYPNLRENDIAHAFMICNHYRFTSIDAIRRKCDSSSFNNYAKMADDSVCVQDCESSDYPEVRDDRLFLKIKDLDILPLSAP